MGQIEHPFSDVPLKVTSQAIAACRGARAVELAVAGWPYDAITEELG